MKPQNIFFKCQICNTIFENDKQCTNKNCYSTYIKPMLTTPNEAKKAFWGKGGVFEQFCDISFKKIIAMFYIGSKIDDFIEQIFNDTKEVKHFEQNKTRTLIAMLFWDMKKAERVAEENGVNFEFDDGTYAYIQAKRESFEMALNFYKTTLTKN